MTPELAAERAAEVLDKARHELDPNLAIALVTVADGWTRLHTALATTQARDFPTVKTKPPVVNIAGWPRIERKPDLDLPFDPTDPPIVRAAGVDHKVVGWDFDRGIDGMGASLRLKLNRI